MAEGQADADMSLPATACLLTAPARGGIAVIRLAGPGAGGILHRIFQTRAARAPSAAPPDPAAAAWPSGQCDSSPGTSDGRTAPKAIVLPYVGRLWLGWIVRAGERLDEAVVAQVGSALDDSAQAYEINIHGGPHVARAVLTLLAQLGAQVLSADALDQSLMRSAPGLTNPAIAKELLAALSEARTSLAASALTAQWHAGLSRLAGSQPTASQLRSAAARLSLVLRLMEPAEVVIAGPPNAGKSAVANALAGRNVSVVNELPGTTRDWVRVLAEAEGVPFWLTDTAGLWQAGAAPHEVDEEAVRRAWLRIEQADIVICLVSGPLQPDQVELVDRLRRLPATIDVAGKADLGWQGEVLGAGRQALAVSSVNFAGIGELRSEIRRRLGFSDFDPFEPTAFTQRQAKLLNRAADAMEAGQGQLAKEALDELLAGQ